jgi:hypothetical protein
MINRIKITHSNYKWTYFRYLSSGARGRMSTSTLKRKIGEGTIEAITPISFSESV